MPEDSVRSQKSIQALLAELVSALYLRPWIDDAEDRHELKREIKAATYHMLQISKDDGSYKAQIIFDI